MASTNQLTGSWQPLSFHSSKPMTKCHIFSSQVNIVVFTLVICSMLSSHRLRKEPLTRRFQRGLKASFVLFPVLGLSWSFGVLTMVTDEIVFNYIFAVLNSLQGFLIFIFHCVLNKQVRVGWRFTVHHQKPDCLGHTGFFNRVSLTFG